MTWSLSTWRRYRTAPASGSRLDSATIDRPRGGIVASIRERLQTDVDARNIAWVSAAFFVVVATVYVTGFVAWKAWGLAEGAPVGLIHSVYDRWDVLNYRLIAENGYGSERHFVAWFPPAPVTMRFAIWLGISPLYFATAVVLALALGSGLVLYLLARLDYGTEVSRDAAILLLIFPTALFLYVPYNESFLVFAAVTAFYFARKRNWALAGLMAGLASGTRMPGLIVGAGIAVEYLHSLDWDYKRLKPDALWLGLAPLGLALYMAYLWVQFDDALAWYHRFRDIPHLETLPVRSGIPEFLPSLIDDVRTIWITHSTNEFIQNTAGLAGLIFWLCAIAAMLWLRMRPSYIAFTVMILGPAIYYGRLDAINRYILPAFPMFIAVALLVHKFPVLRLPYAAASLALLYVTGALFAVYYLPG
jgi:hypothetical protein